MSTKRTVVNNMLVTYADEGEGPVLLFLHGWMHDHHTFDALTSELISHYRVVRLDLPGFGGSEVPPSSWGVGEYAILVTAFIQKLDLKPHVLVGHSFGGRIILKGVGSGVLTAERIVLIAAAGNARRSSARLRLYWILAKIIKSAAFLVPQQLYERFRKMAYRYMRSDYASVGPLADIFVQAISEDLTSFAERIAQPTLLIWGAHDSVTPLLDGKRLQGAIPGSRITVLSNATHVLHQEYPHEVAVEIRAFV